MKKLFYTLALISLSGYVQLFAQQDTIVAWTFPQLSADSLVDGGISLNASRYLSCQYGTWNTPTYYDLDIDYTWTGADGAGDYCATVSGLDAGADSVSWMVKFKTTNYGGLKLYSKQQSLVPPKGPVYFKVQYKLSGSSSPWKDLVDTVLCNNTWTSGVVNGVSLPQECDNQSGQISIRWLQISNLDYNGNPVQSTGVSMIDDIIVTGTSVAGIASIPQSDVNISVYPNPGNGDFTLESGEILKTVKVYNPEGSCLYENQNVRTNTLRFENYKPGMYFIYMTDSDDNYAVRKVLVN